MSSKIKNWQFIQMPKLHVSGITLFPFIVIKHKNLRLDKSFINHEHIHLRQQLEMLVIPFYIFYLLHYLVNRAKKQPHDKAYRNICFEKEAYSNESNLNYLHNRKWFAWMLYL